MKFQSKREARLKLDEFLREGDWIDRHDCEDPRDYRFVYSSLKQYPELAAEVFGGYSGGSFMPFHLLYKEKQKKAFPLTYLLAGKAPLHVIEEIHEMYRGTLSQKQGESGALALHVVCAHGASFEIVSYLLRQCQHAVYEADFNGNLPLHLILKRKQCNSDDDKVEIVQRLLELYPESLIINNALGINPLIYAVKNESTSEELMALIVDYLPESYCFTMQASVLNTEQIVQNMLNLQPKLLVDKNHRKNITTNDHQKDYSLTLRGSNLHAEAIAKLFYGISMPVSVQILRCKFFDFGHLNWGQSRIQRLKIADCTMKEECYKSLLTKIAQMNGQLEELVLEKNNFRLPVVDITDFVKAMLQPGTALRYLACHNSGSMNSQQISGILEQENMTTCLDYIDRDGKADRRIMYYSVMNRHGRYVIARDLNMSKRLLLECLIHLQQDCRLEKDRAMKNIALYGLLRESPGLWSSSV